MSRILSGIPGLYLVEPTPEQYELGVKHTTDLVRRARDICRSLDLPVTELRTVTDVLYKQTGMIVNQAEEARQMKRHRAEQALLDKVCGTAEVRPIGRAQRIPIGGLEHDGYLGRLGDLTDDELNKHLKDAGLDTI